MDVRLYMFGGSNAVLTAQLMLAHKRLRHRSVYLPPGLHIVLLRSLGFPGTTVPALDVDGRRVQGSRAIARVLDELVPERPLFPADPQRRAAVEEAEAFGEALQDAARRVFYAIGRRDPDAFRRLMIPGAPGPLRPTLAVGAPLIVRLASRKHAATDDGARGDVAALPERLDRVDAWIADGTLGGPELNAADFQIGVNLAAMLLADDLGALVRGRPAQQLADRVAPGYLGPIGFPMRPGDIPSELPPAWLPA